MNQAAQYERPLDPAQMKFNGGAWNSRQPDGVLTMVGEWATQEGNPTPDLNAALADAAFVMGLEKNADVVPMECYAPLLVNVNPADPAKGYPKASQWATNLIGYDALRSFGSASYYAQVMLGQNKGDVVLPAALNVTPAQRPAAAAAAGTGPATQPARPAVFATATYVTAGHTVIVKVVNAEQDPVEMAINLRGAGRVQPAGTATVLAGDPKAVNTIEQPTNVVPKEEAVTGASASFRRTFPPHSFTLLRLDASPP
jgi:alpha-N-arabinofuranosidase